MRALAHPVMRHRVLTNFHAESEGVTTDQIIDRLLGRRARAEVGDVAMERRDSAGTVDARRPVRGPVRPGADRQPRAAGAHGRGRLHQRPPPRAAPRLLARLRRAPRLRARRRPAPRGLARVRADRSLLREAVRGRLERQLRGGARRLDLDALRRRGGVTQARLRPVPGGVAALLLAPAARPRGARHLRRRASLEYVPPSARHLEFALYALDRVGDAEAGLAGRRRCSRSPSASRRRGIVVVISDLYDEPEARRAGRAAAALPAGTTSSCSTCSIPAEIDFPFDEAASFEDLESGDRMPIVPEALRERIPRARAARTSAELGRLFTDSRIDYALFNTVGAARPRAVPLPRRRASA
ncbi:MAG: hypothetical protein MZU95_01300 [Desulfomicrobium escambiense]|nr:hypothetical protein [Desulfomicrobium escambiense]